MSKVYIRLIKIIALLSLAEPMLLSSSWGATHLPACTGHEFSARVRDKLANANRVAASGHFAKYFLAAWNVYTLMVKECVPTSEMKAKVKTVTIQALLKLHRYTELESVADEIIESTKSESDRSYARQIHRQAIVWKMMAAAGERDPSKLAAAIAEFDASPGDGSSVDTYMDKKVADYRGCRLEARLSCRNDSVPVFFGQYLLSNDQSHLIPQCDNLPAIQPETYAKGQPFEVIAAAASALNAACETEAAMAALVLAWWDAVYGGDDGDRAIEIGRKLVTKLNLLARQIDGFDSDNSVSRFQVRAMAFFVEQKGLAIELKRANRISYSTEQSARLARYRSEIEPFFDAAIKDILAGRGGFLRADTLGLAAFVAATLYRDDEVWAIAMASHGPQALLNSPSLSDFRAHLRAGQVAIVPVHSIDTDGAIMAFGQAGPVLLEEMYINSRTARFAADLLMNSMVAPPDTNSAFPLQAAESLYFHYVCPAERAYGPNTMSKSGYTEMRPLNAHEILFVADPFLNQIPLSLIARPTDGCLLNPRVDSNIIPFRELPSVRWVSDDYQIRVITFGSTPMNGAKPTGGLGFLGVGNITSNSPADVDDISLTSNQKFVERSIVWGLPVLKATANEVRSAATYFPKNRSTPLLGADATEANVKRALSLGPSIVLFSTHAVAPQTNNHVTEPILKLSLPKNLAEVVDNDDGLLKASEISQLQLRGAIVILAACQSSAPGPGIGNGLFSGLVASFFKAGASDTVATYWEINDGQTATFAPLLVKALAEGMGVSATVQQTQILWRQTHVPRKRVNPATDVNLTNDRLLLHPYYWGGFITVSSYGAWASRNASP